MTNPKLESMKSILGKVTYKNTRSAGWWDKLHEEAESLNLLVVFPVSDDLLYTAGHDCDDYPAWEGTTLFVTDKMVQNTAINLKGKLLLTVTSVWIDDHCGPAWDVTTTSRHSESFPITLAGKLWANGLIIDMDAEMGE